MSSNSMPIQIQANQLHFILFPLMAPGHMIPMVDIAKLLARRGALVTIFTTPLNASRFKTVLSRATESGLCIRLILLEFPCEEVGLPPGCENCDLLPSSNYLINFFTGLDMLQKPVEDIVKELTPPPNCMIADMCFPWTIEVARMLGIPRISFHGLGCFCLLCLHSVRTSKILDKIESDAEYFVVPDLPDRIEVTKPQLPDALVSTSNDFTRRLVAADLESYGVIANTFEELEPEYAEEYKKARNGKVWCVGPVSLSNKEQVDRAQRGSISSVDEQQCLKWLDSWEPGSVVYACLGSLCNLREPHLKELGLGLEASNKPFIWVIRGGSSIVLERLNKWIEEDGFEERIKSRGLLIRGWAPQVLILSHPSIGGFLTHCGWNSTLEAISAGVSMVTWPLFADQFLNERLVTQILKIGVRVGVEVPFKLGEEDKIDVLVKKEDVKRATEELMDEGKESNERRERARKLGLMAKRAVEEGGSSDLNMSSFIQEIMQLAIEKSK
ncbi:UDP-glycosyltransferase 73C25 [Ziziphus jujuba]|uniref:UDP-glycosyltransferase 73C25 n=1 Tax=Ziziphus jujuba TaxID=326968 RepID=A0A6P4ASV5_ZIZJJ|nr:UDP-glycosyltransferase 73C25 [Ziziphus jujuba]